MGIQNICRLGGYSLLLAMILNLATNDSKAENMAGVWSAYFISSNINEKIGIVGEIQSRVHDQQVISGLRMNRLLVRPAIRYFLNPELQVWLGYAWTPNFSPHRGEHRFWQQVLWIDKFDSQSALSHRFRFEERMIQDAQSVSYRMRYMPRFDHWFQEEKKVGFVFWDEFFWNLNSVARGPVSGFDQNRLFLGPMFSLSANSRIEVGYLNVYTSIPPPMSAVMAHILGAYVFVDF